MARGHTVLRVPAGEDLLPFLVLLQHRRVPHRVYEAGGEQVLEVADPAQAERVMGLYSAWRSGELQLDIAPQASPGAQQANSAQRVLSVPVTLLLMALSVAGFLLVYLRAPLSWLSLFTFVPFTLQGSGISYGSVGSEYWRLITPAFLHFGWLHIVFNSLWLWELGNKVERTLGAVHMLGLFFAIALVSNACQYLFGGPSIFGGMSGVVYGLLGFSFVGARLQPRWAFEPSRPIMLLMVGWLLLCMVGFVEVLGFGAIANAAHVGGLLSGAVLGAGLALLSRAR
ncbi:rhomboid family intramembrane serine protease [Haliea sp. E1-2-M8]|uniref:rhomboid family intramembrane serine protease n=1 Tax=Haliea sp. E1-2-M8 TaxID=3064706 RepID=UPI00271F77E4|nr:rhomboid family intramembrane serine protease [Haliea sp. E1-2-M8]MDO8863052.1 rhomboid family intramembrane serine protease [Haliea sp. E1-2-M8]